MSISADELPRNGYDTQGFINAMSERGLANNTVDIIMSNLPKIQRQFGAKPPAMLNGYAAMQKTPNAAPPPQPQVSAPPHPPQNTPPKEGATPELPRNLHTPSAKMMPGANTEPGKMLSKSDIDAFNKAVGEMNVVRNMPHATPYRNPWTTDKSSYPTPCPSKPTFFKDGTGNEYKIVGDKLYVLGWQDTELKVRMVNVSSGKEVPTSGRKFQIYGWHLVNRVEESKSQNVDDISAIEAETRVGLDVQKDFVEKSTIPTPQSKHVDVVVNSPAATTAAVQKNGDAMEMAVSQTVVSETAVAQKTENVPQNDPKNVERKEKLKKKRLV